MKIKTKGFNISSEEEMAAMGIEKICVDKHRVRQENGWMSTYTETNYKVYCRGEVFIFHYYQHFFGHSVCFPPQEVDYDGDEKTLEEIKKKGLLGL